MGGLGGRNVGVATRAFAFLLLDDAAPNARSLADAAFWLPCRFQKLDSCVSVMQSAQDCMGEDVPEALDRAPVRCILPERNMRTPPIIIGGEFRKNPPKVFFIEHDQMIGALAPDRPDQTFNMAILPGRAK